MDAEQQKFLNDQFIENNIRLWKSFGLDDAAIEKKYSALIQSYRDGTENASFEDVLVIGSRANIAEKSVKEKKDGVKIETTPLNHQQIKQWLDGIKTGVPQEVLTAAEALVTKKDERGRPLTEWKISPERQAAVENFITGYQKQFGEKKMAVEESKSFDTALSEWQKNNPGADLSDQQKEEARKYFEEHGHLSDFTGRDDSKPVTTVSLLKESGENKADENAAPNMTKSTALDEIQKGWDNWCSEQARNYTLIVKEKGNDNLSLQIYKTKKDLEEKNAAFEAQYNNPHDINISNSDYEFFAQTVALQQKSGSGGIEFKEDIDSEEFKMKLMIACIANGMPVINAPKTVNMEYEFIEKLPDALKQKIEQYNKGELDLSYKKPIKKENEASVKTEEKPSAEKKNEEKTEKTEKTDSDSRPVIRTKPDTPASEEFSKMIVENKEKLQTLKELNKERTVILKNKELSKEEKDAALKQIREKQSKLLTREQAQERKRRGIIRKHNPEDEELRQELRVEGLLKREKTASEDQKKNIEEAKSKYAPEMIKKIQEKMGRNRS